MYAPRYRELDEPIAQDNAVPQAPSSASFANDLGEAEGFVSARGSDGGIANVHVGTSATDIGDAPGGEGKIGGGCESGSEAWRSQVRRAQVTIDCSRDPPLAQRAARIPEVRAAGPHPDPAAPILPPHPLRPPARLPSA